MSGVVLQFKKTHRKPNREPATEYQERRTQFMAAKERALERAGHVRGTTDPPEFRSLGRHTTFDDVAAIKAAADEALELAAWLIDHVVEGRQSGDYDVALAMRCECAWRDDVITLSNLVWKLPKRKQRARRVPCKVVPICAARAKGRTR